jgi:4,5-DOPA dioxygenase extradiol
MTTQHLMPTLFIGHGNPMNAIEETVYAAAWREAARLSIPTIEHYLPLLYILALQQPDEPVSFFAEGLPLGSISMRSVRIGA